MKTFFGREKFDYLSGYHVVYKTIKENSNTKFFAVDLQWLGRIIIYDSLPIRYFYAIARDT